MLIVIFSTSVNYIVTHRSIRVGEQALYGDEDLADGERQRPVVMHGVDADVAVTGDVRVQDARQEADYRRAHGVADGYIGLFMS